MKKRVFYILLLTLIPLIAYIHLVKGSFVWDDFKVVNDAQNILNPYSKSGIPWINGFYRPIGMVSLQIDYLIWGKSPSGYHFTNILIHVLNTLLIFLLFRKFSHENIAFFSALLFSIHPVTTEVVSWVSCRFDLLALFFGLIAINCLIIYLDTERKTIFLPIVIFSAFSILSKETGFMIIMLLPAVWYFYKKDSVKSIQLFFLFLIILIGLGVAFLGDKVIHVQGSLFYTMLYAFKLSALYFYKLFYWKFISPYSVCLIDKIGFISVYVGIVLFVVIITLIFVYMKRRHIISFSFIWFILLILPGIYASISIYYKLPASDRFLYAALPGLLLFFVYLIYNAPYKLATTVLIFLIPVMLFYTYQKSSMWKNSYSLWKAASETCEYKWSYPIVNYAAASLEYKPKKAEELYMLLVNGIEKGELKSLYKAENDLYRLIGLVRLGYIYDRKNNLKKADEYFLKALKGYVKITRDYPDINKWELSSVNYHLGLHYYKRWQKTGNDNDLNLALSQATLAASARSTELLPNLLKTTILIRAKKCKAAYQSISYMYKLFGKDRAVMRAIYQYDKVCGHSPES